LEFEIYMPLTNSQKKQLKNIGHTLKPVVTVAGNGLSEGVLKEAERAVTDHELVKIKIVVEDRDIRQQVVSELCDTLNSELVQQIGKIALIYRRSTKAELKTSNVR